MCPAQTHSIGNSIIKYRPCSSFPKMPNASHTPPKSKPTDSTLSRNRADRQSVANSNTAPLIALMSVSVGECPTASHGITHRASHSLKVRGVVRMRALLASFRLKKRCKYGNHSNPTIACEMPQRNHPRGRRWMPHRMPIIPSHAITTGAVL